MTRHGRLFVKPGGEKVAAMRLLPFLKPSNPVQTMNPAIAIFLVNLAALTGFTPVFSAEEPVVNGFKLTDLRIERDAILSGGPPRDGIPSIDKPKFISPDQAGFMKDDDIVLSFTEGGITRAYPLRVLVWHEIVNETIAGRPILVTYCPLCGTAMIFDRKVKGQIRRFGVSGLLYQSDVLMYDRESESLWSQLKMEAISGPLSGIKLDWLPSEHLSWKAWKAANPKGEVLSKDTGHDRPYEGEAYASYFESPDNMFPVPHTRDELPSKSWVVGIIADGKPMAFSVKSLATSGKATARLGDVVVTLTYDPESRLARARTAKGDELPTVTLFWFAWQAFYPKTELWKP